MKKSFLLFGILSMFILGYSQTRITFSESFDGTSHGFTMAPSTTWMVDSSLSVSGKKSCWGFIPNNTGDSITLISPIYDLTSYAFVYLRFTHICKVSKEDIVSVEYKDDYVGAKWSKIPNSRYEGSSQTYRKQRTFNDESYLEWVGNDLMAEPDNSWWKTEAFNISQDVSYARVQFRFKIVKGSTLGTQFAWGWLIDNFELLASVNEIKPPVVEFVEPYVNGTVYGTGPFQITAKAAKRTLLPLQTPILRMTFKDMNGVVTYDSVYMKAIEGDSMWIGTIPQKSIGTRVNYSVFAKDTAGNNGTVYSSYLIGRKWGFDSNSVAINSIDTPKRGAIAGVTSPVVITIENRGLKTLSSAVIQWTLNGVQQSPMNWTGTLTEGFSTNVTIGSYVPRLTQYDTIVIWVTSPNGVLPNTTADSIMTKITYGCTQILGGDYIVGPTGQFSTINDALEILNLCGTSGNVNLKLQNGTYVQGIQLFDLNQITEPYDVLTISSLLGNASDVILKNDSTQTMVIDLARSHNVVIKDVTIDAREGTVGVRLTDTCYNIEVSNCNILLDTISALTTGGIIKDGRYLVDKFRILNNTINGGYYGIYIYGIDQNNYNTNLSIIGNTIKNTYYAGIYMRYNQFTHITSNVLTTRPANMGGTYYGLYAYYNHGTHITKNKIRTSKSVLDPIGMYLSYLNYQDSANMVLIANNEIIINITTKTEDAMTVEYTSANIMHNSILRTGQSQGAGIWLVSSASILNIKNNNIVTERGYPIYLASTSYLGSTWFMDYNNYYSSNGNYVGYAGGAIPDMAAWRTTTGQDTNSVSVFPTYSDTSKNLKLANYTNLNCPSTGLVPYDIVDSLRAAITAMGAYTPIPLDFDATVLGAENWSSSVTVNQSTPVNVVFMNVSSVDTLTSLILNWSVNGVLQSPYNWTGSLLSYETDTINLGSFLPINKYNYISIWLTQPNGQSADMNVLNDTINLNIYGCVSSLSGEYTIGGSGADFTSISEAISILNYCKISGAVVFKLASGTYYDLSFTGTYPGTDSTKTVTFTSAADNVDSVIFTGITNGLSITNASNLIFHKITIDAYRISYGILISDSCNNIEISHCNVICDPTITGTQAGIRYYNTTTSSHNIRIIHNTINGGYYGIYFYGQNGNYPTSIIIDSNRINNQYYYGTYFYYTHFKSVSNNVVNARLSAGNTNWNGIRFYYCYANNVNGNKIYSFSTAVTNPYGLYFYYVDDTNLSNITNNEIIVTTTSTYYGIYTTNSNLNIYNNSVLIKGSGAGRALYVANVACTLNIYYNNLITMADAGAHPIYLAGSSYIGNTWYIDYNNYYSNGLYVGYVGSNKTDLAAWKAAVSTDVNSVNIYPEFIDESLNSNIRLFKNTGLTCPYTSIVPCDIDNNTRLAVTTIGAYEYIPLINNALIKNIATPSSHIALPGDTLHLSVYIKNKADQPLNSVWIYWSINHMLQTPYHWTGSLASGDSEWVYLGFTLAVPKTNFIEVYTSQPNGQNDQYPGDDTLRISITGCFSTLNGTYTVGSDATDDFNSLTDLASALNYCGMSGPVLILIDSGTYYETLNLSSVPGNSLINSLTITSTTDNPDDVVIQSTSGDAAITMEGLYATTIKNLTLNGLLDDRQTNSLGIEIKGGNRYLTIRDNIINTCTATSNATSLTGILANSPTVSDSVVCIINNRLEGSGGIYIKYPSSTIIGYDFTIDSNTIKNPYYYGIYTYYANIRTINENFIDHDLSIASYCYYGIYPSQSYGVSDQFTTINNNRLHGNFYAAMYITGLYSISNGWSKTKPLIIANNEVIIKGISSGYGALTMWNGGGYTVVANNTFVNDVGASRPYLFTMYTYNSQHFEFVNNILANYGTLTSYLIYSNWTTNQGNYADAFDYNNYWTGGSIPLAYWAGAVQQNLAAFSATNNNYDSHSSEVNPQFSLPLIDAIPTYWGSMNCLRHYLVQKDFDHQNRDTITYKGAYCPIFDLDASVSSFISPNIPSVKMGDTVQVEVSLVGLGYDTLRSVTIQWQVDGVMQTPINLSGLHLSRSQSMNVVLGYFIATNPSNYANIVVWCENPNSMLDRNLGNDTTQISILVCGAPLAGNYIVGSSASADFSNLNEINTLLRYCGISAPVTFYFESGMYNLLDLYNTPGSNATNTITFTSLNGNAGSVVIGYNDKTAVSLNNSSNLRFTNLTLGTISSVTFYGVKLLGYCENISFYGCNIYANNTSTNSSTAAVYYNNSDNLTIYLKDISFIKNNISGGYYNMYLYYPAGASANIVTSAPNRSIIRIDSNVLTDAYNAGIYSYYYSYYPSISHNTIMARPTNSTFYGMYFYHNTIDTCMGNKIHLINTSTGYGIYSYYLNRNSSYGALGPCVMANNEIISTNGTINYGVYRYRGQWSFVNNSIYLSGTTTNYGIYFNNSSSAEGFTGYNNIVVTNGPQGTTNYPIYTGTANYITPAYGVTLDYNNYYTSTGTIAYAAAAVQTLAIWRSIYGQDFNSVDILPGFNNVNIDLSLSIYDPKLICYRDLAVLTDINNNPRTILTVMGAYATPLFEGYDLALEAFVEPTVGGVQCFPDYTPIKVKIYNQGIYTANFFQDSVILYFSCVNDSVNVQSNATITTGSLSVMSTGIYDVYPSLNIVNPGTYHLKVWMECTRDEQAFNDTIYLDYYVDKSLLPYDNDFSWSGANLYVNQVYGNISWGLDSTPPATPIFGYQSMNFPSSEGRGSISQSLFTSVSLQGTYHPRLQFWYAHDNANPTKRDQMEVKISMDGGQTFVLLKTLYRYNVAYSTPTWASYIIDLSPYTQGSCIIISFVGYSYGGGDQAIDRIRIVAAQDMILTMIPPDFSNFSACDLENKKLSVVMANQTNQPIPYNPGDMITLNITGPTPRTIQYPLSGRLEGFEIDTFEIATDLNFTKSGTYDIVAYTNAIDSIQSNDTAKVSYSQAVDIALKEILPLGFRNVGDTVYPVVKIVNTGSIPIYSPIDLILAINGKEMIKEPITDSMEVGDTITYQFTKGFIVPQITVMQPFYFLNIQTDMTCDDVATNNKKQYSGDVNFTDIDVYDINYPTSSTYLKANDSVNVEVFIYNSGTFNSEGVKVNVEIDSAGVIIAFFSETTTAIAAKGNIQHTFTTKYRVPAFDQDTMLYTVKAYVDATAEDLDLNNDTMSTETYALNDVSIDSYNEVNWTMGQNIPNPASGLTQIPYTVPQDGNITFKLITIKGQTLYDDDLSVTAGSHMLEFEIRKLSNGIYYYSMEYQGQRIIKKLTIQK